MRMNQSPKVLNKAIENVRNKYQMLHKSRTKPSLTIGKIMDLIITNEQKEKERETRNQKKINIFNFNINKYNKAVNIRTNKIQYFKYITLDDLLDEKNYIHDTKINTNINNDIKKESNRTKKKEENELKKIKISVSKANKVLFERKIGRRYSLFKEILNYLESNNITLYELLSNNPFQSKPYELKNSYEFIMAIKFKNYAYVLDALEYSNKYLFSFDYYGQTGYHWAAKLGDLKMMKLLINYGDYYNQKDFKGRTPLYLAAANNYKNICAYLLNLYGNIYLKDKQGLGPEDVATDIELKNYLNNYMTKPFSNVRYKRRIKEFLIEREKKIKERNEQKEKQSNDFKI